MGPHGLGITPVPNLSYRKPLMHDLGKVFSLVWQANEKAIQMSCDVTEDLRAFNAPSECVSIAYQGCDQIVLDAIKTAEAVTGMKWEALVAEIKARTGGRWLSWTLYNSLIPGYLEEEG
jgi:hypothetical protein